MPRLPRLIVPDIAVHIVQRGNDRQACFREDSDYLVYLLHLRDLATKTQCALHAYCLMTNHVHLLLTPRDAQGCATLMRDLGQRYVQYFNCRHASTGTLWEGRPVPLVLGRFLAIRARLPSLYRAQSRARRHGVLAWRISIVEPQGQQRRAAEQNAQRTRRISRSGWRRGVAPCGVAATLRHRR